MKIARKTYKMPLDEERTAFVKFKAPTGKTQIALIDLKKSDGDVSILFDVLKDHIVGFEGVFEEDGSEASVENLEEWPVEFTTELTTLFAKSFTKEGKEEKKDSKKE